MSTTTKHLHALPFWEHLNNAEKDMLRNNAYIRTFDRDSYILHSMAGEDIGLMMLVEGRSVRIYCRPTAERSPCFLFTIKVFVYSLP